MSREAIAATRTWRVAILSLYWAFIFTGTHLPPSPIVRLAGPLPDWLMHGAIFAGLGWLVAWTWGRSPLGRGRAIRLYLLLIGYAAMDEWTQPLVGRQCELRDWMADAVGAAIGMLLSIGWQARRGAACPSEESR